MVLGEGSVCERERGGTLGGRGLYSPGSAATEYNCTKESRCGNRSAILERISGRVEGGGGDEDTPMPRHAGTRGVCVFRLLWSMRRGGKGTRWRPPQGGRGGATVTVGEHFPCRGYSGGSAPSDADHARKDSR